MELIKGQMSVRKAILNATDKCWRHITTHLLNGLIQAAKARARGYRTTQNLITMIYLIGGKLNFGLPT